MSFHSSANPALFRLGFVFCDGILRLLNLYNRCLLHRNAAVLVVAKLNDYGIVVHVNDNSVETSSRKHAVSYCYRSKKSILLLLLLILRTKNATMTTR